MEKRKISLFLAGCVLFILGSTWLLFFDYGLNSQNCLKIFPDSGFYSGDVTVEVKIPSGGGPIYYTVDGRPPLENGSNVKEYTDPIVLHANAEGSAYSLLFFQKSDNGSVLEWEERNYLVLGEDRFPEADYVICVQGDEEALFGYEEGIFVRGRRWDEYVAENPDINPRYVLIPANYYEDKEIPVHATIYTGKGDTIVSQECGIKIYGRAARAQNQKSFRLIARYDYDQKNEFSYPFFERLISDKTGDVIQNYQRLSFHNAGQDNGYAFIRNALCNELAGQAGFPDVLTSRSAAVYINGRYQGIYWLENTYDDRYFNEKYGIYQGEMVVCGENMTQMTVSEEQDYLENVCAEEYNFFCTWLREADVNDSLVWKRITETIDVDNLLRYVAIEYYINNYDWPNTNVKVYRYVPEEGEEYQEGTVFDGRYRYLLYDLDYGMGLIFEGWIGRDAYTEVLKDLCDPSQYAMVFAKVMERKECRDAFISEVINLGNISFSKDNVDRTLEELNNSRWNELKYMMEETDILKDSLWSSDDNSIENVNEELQSIRRFAEDRRARVLTEMMYTWECGALFQVETEDSGEAEVYINGQPVLEDNWYFAGIPIRISAKAMGGIEVKGYEVNGKYVEGDVVELSANEYLKEDEKLKIVPQYEYVEMESLSIRSFSIRGTQDRIILENTGSVSIHLEDYFLSDSSEKLFRGRLPNVILQPGETITVYGRKYEGEMKEGSFQMDFSWDKEEPVILSHLVEGMVEYKSCYK